MKRKLFRLVASIMALVMIFLSTTTTAIASGNTVMAESELKLFMNQLGYESDVLEGAMEKMERYRYTTFKGIDGIMDKMVLSNGDKVYNVIEGDVTDVIVIKANGDIYLDGSLVKLVDINEPEKVSTSSGKELSFISRAQRYEITDICPYETYDKYSFQTDYVRKNLMLEQEIRYVTEQGFKIIIGEVLKWMYGPVISKLLKSFFSGVLSNLKESNPYSKAFSMQYYRYVHETLGFSVTDSMSVAKYIMSFYEDLNLQIPIEVDGTSVVTAYEVFTY